MLLHLNPLLPDDHWQLEQLLKKADRAVISDWWESKGNYTNAELLRAIDDPESLWQTAYGAGGPLDGAVYAWDWKRSRMSALRDYINAVLVPAESDGAYHFSTTFGAVFEPLPLALRKADWMLWWAPAAIGELTVRRRLFPDRLYLESTPQAINPGGESGGAGQGVVS